MKFIVWATVAQWNEFTGSRTDMDYIRVEDGNSFNKFDDADAIFCLQQITDVSVFKHITKPVFINSVTNTLASLNAPANVLRINGWATFLNRHTWEIAGKINNQVINIFNSLNIKIHAVADEPGFVSARVIAMIINEAYFALGDDVSGKEEIDIAMKLGTNYPYGPFEWATFIGEKNILTLLQKLFETNNRYQPAALLIEKANQKNA
ncbi:MAG TPA: 3-hydroxyacyl-CoA dehydrogenase family protein [Ferruginibacter sp.]|nr:3-hydroxyacyl-CoA dehydrogenase family protein [Ferruginibacter sp.]